MKTNHTAIDDAFAQGIQQYFSDCRERVDPFVVAHFSLAGTWQTNKHAWGWDLLRAPLNLCWAPIYVALNILRWLLRQLGFIRCANWLCKVPGGLTTSVQKYLEVCVARELLCLHTEHHSDSLQSIIVRKLDQLAAPTANHSQLIKALQPIVQDALKEYTITRTASADITNSLLSTLVGAFAFHKFTPGGFAIGFYLAGTLAHYMAVDNFLLGNFWGEIYYGLFPASPSPTITTLSVAGTLITLAIFASFSGVIIDPIQYWLGIHRKRLHKLLNHLERDLQRNTLGGFKPKDQYVARILELLDAARAQLL